ncbi:nuclease-like protein [Scopulibacillus darangshiensis]|uniref:Nuclease-like protein n=1 Tax=Scopulibacillus darangshiensis TaxID=442528 RepID=A0A4R2P6R9_9BACL|nr:nuclease-related domain-containing protein [Scopulibacillus darangshiensis]TCP30553.1 nuclease-like protein [Scopulibacillus darangshiensis]
MDQKMLVKPRYEPLELKLYRYLHARTSLSAKDLNYYRGLAKGFKGEQKFDMRLEKCSNDWLILNDLLFEKSNTVFQIDTIVISQEVTYLFDVKNYEGDFYTKNNQWYTISGDEIKNPLLQLKRNESLFRRLLQDLGSNVPIEAYLIFIHPEFHLYQSSPNLPIIFPTQLNRFLNKINKKPSKLNEGHSRLSNQLLSAHLKESPYTKLPVYHYDQLEKGVPCANCNTFLTDFNNDTLICKKCGCRENTDAAILRCVEEYKILFPDKKVTTNAIHDWCKIISSKKTIRRVLSKRFEVVLKGRSSYYL